METTTTIRNLADRMSRHPMLKGIPFETVVDYAVDFLRIVDVPALFEDRTCVLELDDYRAPLPCDYVEVIQVRALDKHDRPVQTRSYRASTGSFMPEGKKGRPRLPIDLADAYYKIQGNVFYSSRKEGKVEMAYRAIMTDGEGFPLLPDNPKFLRALESYIKKQWFTVLFDLGSIAQAQMNQALQDYAFAVGACENEFKSLSLDQAQSLLNSWRTLVERTNAHDTQFRHDGAPERLINH